MSLPDTFAASPFVPGQKNQKKSKAQNADSSDRQKITLLAGGGLLALLVVVGLVYWTGGLVGGGSSAGGQYAVVDSFTPTDQPTEQPDEQPVPLDIDYVPVAAKAPAEAVPPKPVWTVKPDPPSADETPLVDVVGALTPEPSLLLASLGGPYAVGVPPDPARARRAKALKGADGKPGELVSIDKAPHSVVDIRTGQQAGEFPAAAQVRFASRLSPDGRYLASFEFEVQQSPSWKVTKDELVVWSRNAEEPACRWPLPGAVLWADFLAPDRLALYHTTPSPQFVVLDVAKGTPVVTAPLPADEFSAEHDLNPRQDASSYRVETTSGAISPGRKLIALGGRTHIALLQADGQVVGKLPVEQVYWARNYLGMSFNEDGSQLRALTQQGGGGIYLRVWSLTDGQALHTMRYMIDPRAGLAGMLDTVPPLQILSGPEPNSLIVGDRVVSLAENYVYAELPYQPQRRLDANRMLALGTVAEAHNADALSATADFVPRGKSLIVAALSQEELLAKAPKVSPAVVASVPKEAGPPPPLAGDRSKATTIRLQPPTAWSVKPAAEVARPTGPLPLWPDAFAESEAAVIDENLSWKRYDLNTGQTIGEPIELWPGQPRPKERVQPMAALARDGKRLALVDPRDLTRVDVWDTSGKRLIGLRPYEGEPIFWHGWSADGKLLTADGGRLTAWNAQTGQAAFEVTGKFARFMTAPAAEWMLAMTPARHLFFVDTANGQILGHIPASTSCPEHTLSPDGKMLVRLGRGLNLQVWDLQTGKRKSEVEMPLVPPLLAIGGAIQGGVRQPDLGVSWIGPRLVLSLTKFPGEQQAGYYLYDLDAHLHTYRFSTDPGTFQNDSLGRAWMTSHGGGSESWIAPSVPNVGAFNQTVVFGPGTTIQVEVDVLGRENSQKTAEKMAASLAARGFKIGRGGWILRADHTISDTLTNINDTLGQRVRVATLGITWRLLDPAGKEAWKGNAGGKFDPFNSKYVVLGSRKTDMALGGMGGGSTQVRLDYQGKDAATAQLEEILEKYWYSGVPRCLVKKQGEYLRLPLAAK
jgi:hypothetical protein